MTENTSQAKFISEKIKWPDVRGRVNRASYWKHKRGLRKPGVESAKVYCDVLHITLEEFFSRIQ